MRIASFSLLLVGACTSTTHPSVADGGDAGMAMDGGDAGDSGLDAGDAGMIVDAGPCAGVWCQAHFTCNPADGQCECGSSGFVCDGGDCNPTTSACIPQCQDGDGGIGIIPGSGASGVPLLAFRYGNNMGEYQLLPWCNPVVPVVFTANDPLPPGLVLHPRGNIDGAVTIPYSSLWPVTVTVVDALGRTGNTNLDFVVIGTMDGGF